MLGRLPKVLPQSAGAIFFSRQLDYSIAAILFQALFERGGAFMYIFRPWVTRKDGTKDYAKNHGKKAFRFWIGPGPEPVKKNK